MRRPAIASFRLVQVQRLLAAVALAGIVPLAVESAQAQLTWGVNGAGGAGTWDATTANWYNGTANVPWDGNAAIFAGASGGAVTAQSFLPVQAMVFNTAGYSINGGFFNSPGDLTVTANVAATINSTCASNGSGGTFIKNGSGTLTYAGVNFFDNVRIDSGEYVATTQSAAFFSAFTLANAAGVTLTLGGSSSSLGGLSGGGGAGGIVRPSSTQNGVVSVTNFGSGSFGGVLQDNGGARLGWEQFGGTQTLTGVNTYTGPTSVSVGTLTLAGGGSVLGTSAVSVQSGSSLVLDNTATVVGNRVADSLAISVSGGQVSLIGNASAAVTETLGALQLSGGSTVSAAQPGSAAARLSFSGITRGAGATLNVTGNGGVTLGGVANGSNGIIGAYVTAGNEWAVVGPSGTVQALTNYNTNAATAGAADHVKLTAASTALAPSTATTWNTLNLQNADTTTHNLDLGAGSALTLAGGGVLSSGAGPASITNGALAAGGELVVINNNALGISSNITETATGTALTKSGSGTLTLTGANTYSGPTNITQGTLAVSSDANLGTGTNISFGVGTLQANASFTTAKNLTLATNYVGSINTNGYNVTVGGTNSGLQQIGAGTLTLTNRATGFTSTSPTGTLVLRNATSGNSTIAGGTLRAAGTLDGLTLNSSGTLDIGGSGAQSLSLGSFRTSGSGSVLTVRFTLGSTAQDQLSIASNNVFGLGANSLLFTIDQLGALQTGVNYTVINLPNGSFSYQLSDFALSPESMAAGYKGSFAIGANAVTLSLTSVPEPSTLAALVAGAALLAGSCRLRSLTRC